jgi:uncharacterized protein HemX
MIRTHSIVAQAVDPSQAHRFLTEQNYTTTGVVVAILIAVGLGAWRAASWFGKEIAIPARDRGFLHLDNLNTTLEQANDTMKSVSASLQRLASVPERLDSIEGKVDNLSERVDNMDTHLNSSRISDK